MQDVNPQRAFRAVAQGDGLPSGRGLLLNPAVNPQGRGLRLKRGRGTTAGRLGRWDDRLRILQVNPLVLVNIPDEDFALILKGAQERGMVQLKGHRSVGGMRASIYNAMPIEGVRALAEYMREFERQHG